MSVHEIIHHGWLVKSPHDVKENFVRSIFKKKKWKRRYFLLTMVTSVKPSKQASNFMTSSSPSLNSSKPTMTSRLEMSYYESEHVTKKAGTIDLERCEEVLSHLQSSSYQHVFAIKTIFRAGTPRTYFLAAATEADMTAWVGHLCKYLRMIHENPNRYSNRSSAGINAHYHIHQQHHHNFSSLTNLDGRSGINRTPTQVRKPMSIDYTDDYSLASLPRGATLQRLNSFSRNPPQSPLVFHPNPPSLPPLPQCPPPSDFHQFLPLLITPSNTLPRSRLQYEADQKLSSDDKSLVYFSESVAQLLVLQQKTQSDNIDNDTDATTTTDSSHYDTPTKKYNRETEEMHLYQNRISEFYDVPVCRNGNIYSKEALNFGPEYYTSLPEDGSNDLKDVYSVPCKNKNINSE